MSYSLVKAVSFGTGKGSLSTVGYALYAANGSEALPRTTTGVLERPLASGVYFATVAFPDEFRGLLVWDTGEVSPSYHAEAINPGQCEYQDAAVSSRSVLTTADIAVALTSQGYTGPRAAKLDLVVSAANLGTAVWMSPDRQLTAFDFPQYLVSMSQPALYGLQVQALPVTWDRTAVSSGNW